jgi:prolipoprotein diacylglyceryltransferase
MLGLILRLERHKSFPGFTFLLTLIFYGLLRLVVDFFRYFEETAILVHLGELPITINQGISLTVLVLAVFFFLRFHSRRAALDKSRPQPKRS